MHKIAALLLLMMIGFASYSQDDDIPDYRSKKDLYKKITDKDLRGDLAAFTLSSLDEAQIFIGNFFVQVFLAAVIGYIIILRIRSKTNHH